MFLFKDLFQFFVYIFILLNFLGVSFCYAAADDSISIDSQNSFDEFNTSIGKVESFLKGPVLKVLSLVGIVTTAIVLIIFPRSSVAPIAIRVLFGLIILNMGTKILSELGVL